MSIATELTLLANSKQAIKNSINQKGGNITDSTPLADYSTAIDNLPSGGSGNPLLESIDVSDFSGTTFQSVNKYITGATIPSGVTTIGSSAFYGCISLTSITIPSGVTSINSNAFDGCTSLTSVTIPSGVTTIAPYAFQNTGLTSVIIPNTVTSLGNGAFNNCSSLTSVTVGNGITNAGMGQMIFAFDNNLSSVILTDGLTSIGVSMFNSCTSLTSINIPSSVTEIENMAFKGCTAMSSVIVNATTPPTLGSSAFDNTSNCPIYVPASSVDTYKAATGWSTYASRIQAIPEDVKPAFKFTSSVDSSKDITVNCEDTATAGTLTTNDLGMSSQQIDEFKSAENTGSVEIGDCVKIYRATNCYTAKGISEVKLNEGLERIEDFAFGGMSALREITIPSTVTNISYQAFYADRALQGITCLATTPPTLGSDVFGDTNNCTIYVPGSSLESYKTAWSQYADRIEPI